MVVKDQASEKGLDPDVLIARTRQKCSVLLASPANALTVSTIVESFKTRPVANVESVAT
jgi:hypothetical protein